MTYNTEKAKKAKYLFFTGLRSFIISICERSGYCPGIPYIKGMFLPFMMTNLLF
jgi:hypothetical protein